VATGHGGGGESECCPTLTIFRPLHQTEADAFDGGLKTAAGIEFV
jgi:hypothetical protein